MAKTKTVLGPGAKGDPENPALRVDTSDATVEDLKEQLKKQGLSTSGTKDELVKRLSDNAPAPTGQGTGGPTPPPAAAQTGTTAGTNTGTTPTR